MTRIDPRALSLPEDANLRELDRRFFEYVESLPPPLNVLARDASLFGNGSEPRQIASLRELHPLVTCLPWLFAEAFPAVTDEDLLAIAELGVPLVLALLTFDYTLDGQIAEKSTALLLHRALHDAALKRFRSLWGTETWLWSRYDRYFSEYIAALVIETDQHWGRVTPYSLDTIWKIGSGKVALLKLLPAALIRCAHAEAEIMAMEKAFDAFSAALQLADDVVDWADDYEQQHFTLPLTQALSLAHDLSELPSVEEVSRLLETASVLEALLVQAIVWFQDAIDAVAHLNCPLWVEFVQLHSTYCQDLRKQLVAKKLQRLIAPYVA